MFTELKKFSTRFRKIWLWCAMASILALPATAQANDQFTPSELDTLVSTIALYPDPLLVQVLAASVHVDEIPGAADWANQHKNLKGNELAERIKLEDLPYDESVQALLPFPTVLATMAKYQVWTDQLGDAVSTQKDQVMDAVQRMRNAAYSHGHLQSNDQVKVIKEKTIIIEPVQKEYVYVPVYNPHVVYYVYSNGYSGLRYRSGVWVGGYYDYWGWGTSRFEWDTHLIYVHDYRWYHNRPRPPRPPRYYSAPPPRHHNSAPPRHHNPPPPRNDRYAVPPSQPAKVPMNHHSAPMTRNTAPMQPAVNSGRSMNARTVDDSYWQDDNSSQNRNSTYRNGSSSRSSDRNSGSSRSGNGRGGFGRSMRK